MRSYITQMLRSSTKIAALIVGVLILKIINLPSFAKTAHDFTFTSIDGGLIALSQYKGKVILLVNSASKCGFTGQYTGLQNLWRRYRKRGLVVIGVPSDDFGGQEFDDSKRVKTFCELNYDIDFPMTEITRLKGPQKHPYYKWIAEQHGGLAVPRWNFHKHLIDGDGNLIDFLFQRRRQSRSKY